MAEGDGFSSPSWFAGVGKGVEPTATEGLGDFEKSPVGIFRLQALHLPVHAYWFVNN
jgi:hypothetical protein